MSEDAFRTAGAGVRYAKETTYGTDPGSWNITLDPLSYSGLITRPDKTARRGMNMGGSMVKRGDVPGRINVPFGASHYLTYAGMGLLFSVGLGDAVTTGPVGSKFTHTWTLKNDPVSFTAGIVEGEGLGSLSALRREGHGVVISELMIENAVHDTAIIDLKGMGQSADTQANASAVTITNADDTYIEGHHLGNISWNGRSDPCISVKLTVPHGASFRDRIQERTTARPYAVNLKEIEVEVVMEKITAAYDAASLADTKSDLVLTWTDPDNANQSMVLTLENAGVTVGGDDASGPSIINQTLIFRPNSSAGKTGLKIVLTNEDSSAEAA